MERVNRGGHERMGKIVRSFEVFWGDNACLFIFVPTFMFSILISSLRHFSLLCTERVMEMLPKSQSHLLSVTMSITGGSFSHVFLLFTAFKFWNI